MALIYRNGRPYLYRSLRRNGRVTSQYVAAGESAVLINALGVVERDKRDTDRFDRRSRHEALDEAEEPLIDHCERAEDLARAALYAAGYHRPKRVWRRKRRGQQDR